jgi:hypothetical protein
MKKLVFFVALPLILLSGASVAQSPNSTPIIVDAATAVAAQRPAPNASAMVSSGSLAEAIRQLQQMKAANQDILKRQETVLQQLQELQKAAEQLKIFSKRG